MNYYNELIVGRQGQGVVRLALKFLILGWQYVNIAQNLHAFCNADILPACNC